MKSTMNVWIETMKSSVDQTPFALTEIDPRWCWLGIYFCLLLFCSFLKLLIHGQPEYTNITIKNLFCLYYPISHLFTMKTTGDFKSEISNVVKNWTVEIECVEMREQWFAWTMINTGALRRNNVQIVKIWKQLSRGLVNRSTNDHRVTLYKRLEQLYHLQRWNRI